MHYIVFWPSESEMEKAGFGYISKVPVLFDESWHYHREASWYLRDRSKGEAFTRDTGVRAFPVRSSMSQYAYKLADFLAWCDWVKRPWQEVDYHRDLVSRYQKHMLNGDWAAERGQKLSPSTVNGRVDEAVGFCKWAAQRGLRGPIDIQTKTTHRKGGGIRSDSHKSVMVESRTGKVRPKPIRLRIPQEEKVELWIKQFRVERGETKALMAELIVRTAIRREEAAQWRTSYLPKDRSQWEITGSYVSVLLLYGTKGDKERYIDAPLELAERLAVYENVTRPRLRMLYVNSAKDAQTKRLRLREKEDRLFLSDATGTPVTAKKLYEAWKEVSKPPIDGWSPHLGRHYWTCVTLLKQYKQHIAQASSGDVVTPDWAMALGRSDLLTFVKPQLGHIDAKTSEAYIVWLGKMVRSAQDTQQWIDSLEIDRSNDDEEEEET